MQYISHYRSPIGDMLMAADGTGLTGLWFEGQKYFADQLDEEYMEREIPLFEKVKKWLDIYFSGKEPDFTVPLHFKGTAFQKEVWEILCTIPYGRTMTYGEIAEQIAAEKGLPRMSARAVGGAVGHNRISVIVPCHRVVGANGRLTGYAGGIEKKMKLLALEKTKSETAEGSDIKIAFFDIDGTLIDFSSKNISAKTLETLTRLKEKGIILCLATGRSPMALPQFSGIEFDVFLTYNGSYCYNNEKVIFSNPIPAGDISRLVCNAKKIGRPVSVATKDRLAANGTDQDLADYYAIAGLDAHIAEDFDEVLQREIYQMMMGGRQEEYPYIMEGIKHAKIAAWWDRAIDIIPADGGKGKGIEKVLEYYHLDRSEAIAFGDGDNDIEMLQSVGTGVAMANGSEKLKAAATEVCGHAAEDGIYHYCLEHGLL